MERTQLEHLEDWLSRDDHKESPWFHVHDLLRIIDSIKKQSDSNKVASSQPIISTNEESGVCPKCNDRGWIYTDETGTRDTCHCHYEEGR